MSNIKSAPKLLVKEEMGRGINYFEKLLPLWVAICILMGIILSQVIPGISQAINAWQISGISIPIGICLFFMMYPAMLNLQASELKKLGKNPRPIIITLVSNWLIAPFVGLMMALIFLPGNEQLIVAIILLSSSPCTAMVLVWGWMCKGNQEQNVITTSMNTLTIILLYVPMVALLISLANIALETDIPLDPILLLISLIFFIGLPLTLGLISKKLIINSKGVEWFDNTYRPIISKIAIGALLLTLVVLFSLNGNVLVNNPDLLLIITIPLLIGFAIVVSINVLITKIFRLNYREAIITVIIGSSSHFEIAIAVAIAMYGIGSIAALGTTMGLFWEVPIMLSIVYLGMYLGKHGFWPNYEIACEADVDN
ncbi:MAG: arsenic resistance protein [Promethearchaeota archaeon]